MIVGPATIVAGGAEPRILAHAGLRVVGAHVAALGPFKDVTQAFPEDPVWDTAYRIVLPGFINGMVAPHAVLGEGLAGYGAPGDAGPTWRTLEDELGEGDLFTATQSALIQGLRHGVTTSVLVVSPFHAGAAGLEAIARAAESVRARALIVVLVNDRRGPAEARVMLDAASAFVEKTQKGWGDRLRAMPGVGPLADVSQETLAAASAAARRLGVGVFALAGADERDARDARERHGSTPIGRLVREQMLDAKAIVAPGRALPETDWELLRASGAAWVSTPREDIEERGMHLDYVALAERGLVPALGSGGLTPHMPGEGEMIFRGARLHGRTAASAKTVVARALFERGPDLGQRHFVPALGLLAPGSPADLVVLDVYPATPFGPENWTDHLVQSLATARIHAAMVAGDLLLQDGRALVADERELQQKSRAIVHRLWPRVTP